MGGNVGLWSMVTPDIFVQMCLTIYFCTQGTVRSGNYVHTFILESGQKKMFVFGIKIMQLASH